MNWLTSFVEIILPTRCPLELLFRGPGRLLLPPFPESWLPEVPMEIGRAIFKGGSLDASLGLGVPSLRDTLA